MIIKNESFFYYPDQLFRYKVRAKKRTRYFDGIIHAKSIKKAIEIAIGEDWIVKKIEAN